MTSYLGMDIGGTKIAMGVFSAQGELLSEDKVPTPKDYEAFLQAIEQAVAKADAAAGARLPLGVGIPGVVNQQQGMVDAPNLVFLRDKPFRDDLKARLGREIKMANDGSCLVLAEAIDGAGAGYETVFGLVAGTGIGGGYVAHGHILLGANGLNGEVGHLPLPFRQEEGGGPPFLCGCGQDNCIEGAISGPALARLHNYLTGQDKTAQEIGAAASAGDPAALASLARYYDSFAKGMVSVLHSFDPDVIVVSGGLMHLPGFFEEIPKRWGRYCYVKQPRTKFVPALFGTAAYMRGAAWLWRTQQGSLTAN